MELAPAENSRLTNYRPMFLIAAGMMAGIAACGIIPEGYAAVLAGVAAVSAGVFLLLRKKRLVLFSAALLLGAGLAFFTLPTQFKEGRYRIEGNVADIIEVSENGTVLRLDNVSLDGQSLNKSAETAFPSGMHVEIGDRISAEASCRMPKDGSAWYNERLNKLSTGIGCIADAESITIKSKHNLPLTELVVGIRNSVSERISKNFDDDSGIFNALILGLRSEVGEERYAAYRTSGAAHLLALSGFHVGVLLAAVSGLIPRNRRKLRLPVITVAVLLYCTVAAYAPGLVRAGIMAVCYLAADRFERRADPLSALSIAAVLILIWNPYQLYSVGFRLSFAACFGIALFNSSFKCGLEKTKLPSKIGSSVAVSASAIIGTFAFQMHYFRSFAPYAVICNLIAVPLFSLIVILGLLVTAFAFIFPAGAAAAAIVPRSLLFAAEKVLSAFGSIPGAQVEMLCPPIAGCVIYLLLIFVLSEYVLRPLGKKLPYAAVLMFLFTFSCFIGIIKA